MVYQGRVRIIGRNEIDNVMELCRQLHSENGMFKMDDAKVYAMLDRAFDRQGGILAGVGQPGKLEGLLYLLLSTFWYSNDPHWEELFCYTAPEFRKTTNASELLKFAKWITDETPYPLMIGIFSNETTERKERFYDRKLQGAQCGKFYLYHKTRIRSAQVESSLP